LKNDAEIFIGEVTHH